MLSGIERNRKGYKRIKVIRKEEKDGSNWRREVYRKERKKIRVKRDGENSHLRNEIFAQRLNTPVKKSPYAVLAMRFL